MEDERRGGKKVWETNINLNSNWEALGTNSGYGKGLNKEKLAELSLKAGTSGTGSCLEGPNAEIIF